MIIICCTNRICQRIGINVFFKYSMQKVQVCHSQKHSQLHLLAMFNFGKFQKRKWHKTILTPEILILPLISFSNTKDASSLHNSKLYYMRMLTVYEIDFHVGFLFLVVIGKSQVSHYQVEWDNNQNV